MGGSRPHEKVACFPPKLPILPEVALTMIEVSIDLYGFSAGRCSVANTLRDMASTCLAQFWRNHQKRRAAYTGLLTVNYLSFDKQDHERILFPFSWSVRKR